MFGLGLQEIIVLLVIGVLLFGKRLPEVGRQVGKMYSDFRRSLAGYEEGFRTGEFPQQQEAPVAPPPRPPQRVVATTPKFEDVPSSSTPVI